MSDPSQFAGAPPPITEEDETEYIGPGTSRLSGGYRAQTKDTRTHHFDPTTMGEGGEPVPYRSTITSEVGPRYKLGDEWSPQTQSWDPVRVADMQAQLVDAGLLDPDKYERGWWDEESARAYRQLLGYANVSGLDSHQTLQRIGEVKSRFGTTGDKAKVRQPFISELTDPVALSDLLDEVSVRRMGRGLSLEEKERFSTSFRGLQESSQRQAYEASGSGLPGGPGGSVTAPNPQARAEAFVTETRPDDVAAYQYLQAFKSFENLLSRTRK